MTSMDPAALVRTSLASAFPERSFAQIQWIDAAYVHHGSRVMVPVNRTVAEPAFAEHFGEWAGVALKPVFVRHRVLVVIVERRDEPGVTCDLDLFEPEKR